MQKRGYSPPPPASSGVVEQVVVAKGLLRFSSIADYKQLMDQPTPEAERQFTEKVRGLSGFTSLQRACEQGGQRTADDELAELIDNTYFKEMLNEDLSVWIEDWVFRVNPEDEKVYVIDADLVDTKYDELIAQNTGDPDVKEYSTALNVLDIVGNPDDQPQGLFCSQSGIGSRNVGEPLNDGSGRTAFSAYAKYGIYFSLFTRIETIGSSAPVYRFDYSGNMWLGAPHVYYHVRCGSTADYATVSTGTWTGTAFKYQSYQGSTALNQVYYYVHIRSNTTPYAQLATQFGFRVNI